MTEREKADIVEHVERAIFGECQGYSYKPEARAAIRATLEYLRENVSEKVAEAFQDAAFEYREGSFITREQGVSRVVSAALNDIEGGAG
jgi:hypothetical protein